MAYTHLSFANIPPTVFVKKVGMAANTNESIAPPAAPQSKVRSWSLLDAFDKASLAFSRNMTAWATAGRL